MALQTWIIVLVVLHTIFVTSDDISQLEPI